MTIALSFIGAASTVTGSCFLLEHAGGRLLVDCGMFQGTKTVRELNYGAFPFRPADIDCLLLTHAHIDHSGLIPKLWRDGFRGPIHATAATADLLRVMLPDSGAIQESEVERLNRRNRQRGQPQLQPIYTRRDAERCLELTRPVEYDRWLEVGPGVRARYWNAGHILGSASIELEIDEPGEAPLRILFSGDLGPDEKSFHADPAGPSGVDYLLCESTYGDRDRVDVTLAERRQRLKEEVTAALGAGGNLVIPAFAVERTQELLVTILDLIESHEVPKAQVFIDSPLAIEATEVFARHRDTLQGAGDPARLFKSPQLHFCRTAEESKAINRIREGAIVIAASGMCEAGRIRHHLKNNLWRPEATVLFVGYQAPGSLGQLIQAGEPVVRILGEEVAVHARIRQIDSFSAHADQKELVAWVMERRPVRQDLFLTHGEPQAMRVFKEHLVAEGLDGERILAPTRGQRFELRRDRRSVAPGTGEVRGEGAATRDWHNAYARLRIDLDERLRALPDDAARDDLVRRVAALLPGG